MGFQLEYPITRPYPNKWFTPISLTLAAIVIISLTVINVALTGYETVVVFKTDFHAKDTHWYDSFMPTHENKRKCDPTVYKVGDVFKTNASFFEWRVESITDANAATGLAYQGGTMESCDLSSLFIDGALYQYTVGVTALIKCRVENVGITARTSFSISALPGKYESLISEFYNITQSTPRLAALQAIELAGEDLGFSVATSLSPAGSSVVALSARIDFPYCPSNTEQDAPCLHEPPTFTYGQATIMYINFNITEGIDPASGEHNLVQYTPLADNLAQTVYAAVRVDIGNNHPNNILLNPSAIESTLHTSFPTLDHFKPKLMDYLNTQSVSDPVLSGSIPLSSSFGSSFMETTYLCRFQRLKEPGTLFITVLVATLSMFSSAWAIYMALAMMWWKRKIPDANQCDSHGYDSILPLSPEPSTKFPKFSAV